MPDIAYDELTAFEKQADERMQSLSLWKLPHRSVYSTALLGADAAFSGGRFRNHREPDPDKGGTMLARYSYWSPYLRQCTREIGADIADALGVMTPDAHREITQALLYSHFCELMPFVHRKTLAVERTPTGFHLRYPSEAAARFEALDVIASELALTALAKHFKYDPHPLLRMVETWPHIDAADLHSVLRQAYAFHTENVREDAFMSTNAYERVLGFRHDEFISVRAAMMAFASWCLGMANAAEAHAIGIEGKERDRFGNECFEWLAPLLRRDFVHGTIQQLAEVPADRVAEILRYFEEDPFSDGGISGEGYLTPLKSYDGSVLVSPRAMHQMTPERNILYALNKLDRRRFDEFVSAELEPSLLVHAKQLIDRIPGVETRTNVLWRGGEIDLLAFCQATNSAIQIQAKAAIPPNGARMTRQLETNTRTAVRQLQGFERLSTAEKDALVQTGFGVRAHEVRWASGVLSRSAFGSVSAWEAIGDRAAMNLPLLKLVTEELAAEPSADLSTLPDRAAQTLGEIADEGIRRWDEEPLDVFGTTVIIPLLQLDNVAISRRRAIILA
ncbi:MAG: hypothetical protein EOQ28_09595 [Mesorhizobium sp.]|uniref:hypothetical protein n=1 Tax=Mesorhizobium sp. TaxID=1871066 RepID=UPI000FE8E37B|nr:hypothetical protein [Mesorhizobium sp.]RWA75339.1 MAG: hypothetical protein EOQ28_09595 [Mesorhizobium sp.]